MRNKSLRVLAVGVAIFCYFALTFAQSSTRESWEQKVENVHSAQPPKPTTPSDNTQEEKSVLVDYDADEMINRGDNITRLVGNVTLHHNGAIIQCDSAFMYEDDRMEFFVDVVIEKDSALIYGDRVMYNGNTNKADVYAPIVKMMRGEAIMYSYNLQFDTKTSVGTFHSGGTLVQRGNQMEAQRGEFDANANYIKFFDRVALENTDYLIKTDSIGFSLDDERLDFIARTYIWNDGETFLKADGGNYFSTTKSYLFNENAFVMTPDNEIWADTMRYYTESKKSYMFNNVQILDTANMAVAFADWAFYDDSVERAVLSDDPAVKMWREKSSDTTFMRADTILLVSIFPDTTKNEEFTADMAANHTENSSTATVADTAILKKAVDSLMVDSMAMDSVLANSMVVDSMAVDMETIDSVISDTLLKADLTLADSLSKKGMIKLNAEADSRIGDSSQIAKKVADTVVMPEVDSLVKKNNMPLIYSSLTLDSAMITYWGLELDSTFVFPEGFTGEKEVTVVDSVVVADTVTSAPPTDRIIKAYKGVLSWSEEYQMKCDSLVAYSADSTAILFGAPILWNTNNQMSATTQINAYTKNEQLDWAEFIGSPVVAQQVRRGDTLLFNQAISDELTAYFTDNIIDYTFMDGNVQNIYYMTEGRDVSSMVVIECQDLTMLFDEQEPVRMIWGGGGKGPIYPMNKIPADQSRFLPGFTWQDSIRPRSRWDITDRIERKSERKEVEKYTKPKFPITEAMDKKKAILLKDERWRDRVDLPTLTPDYFLQRNEQLFY